MQSIANQMTLGGPMIPLILMTASAMLVFGVLHIILARKWTFSVTLILFLIPLLLGVLGYVLGTSQVDSALVGVDPSQRAALAAAGYAEAKISLYFGLGAGGAGLLPLIIGEVRRRGKAS